MPSSAEVNSIKQGWLYGRVQLRRIELRGRFGKKIRDLSSAHRHTMTLGHLQKKTFSRKQIYT